MDKQVESIILIFKNDDLVGIPFNSVIMLRLNQVTYNYHFYPNKINISATANDILLLLNIDLIKNINSMNKINILSRIMKYEDITCIQLHYIDHVIEEIYTKYDGIEYNKLQHTKINNNVLTIKIG